MLQRILEPEVMDDTAEAAAYDAMDHTQPNTAFVQRLIDLGIDRCKNALDLGTGPGDIPILLCQAVSTVGWPGMSQSEPPEQTGVDISQALRSGGSPSLHPGHPKMIAVDLAQSMINLAQNKIAEAGLNNRITLAKMDVKKLDLPDDSFDALFSNTILHHIPEPGAMLTEAARVLKPGGLLLIRDLYRPKSIEQLNALVDQHAGGCDGDQRKLFAESLHAALTPDELRELAQANGLADADVVIDTDRHMSLQRVPRD
ncbi:MAG: class I SAM-dependent methyltransferase [Planctomycetota bacterium]